MISMVLLGRTGNHLFQYALGRVLAQRHGVELVLDGSWFNAAGWREVSHFLKLPIQARVVRRASLAARVLRKLTGKHYWEFGAAPILREEPADHGFDPRFLAAPSDCVLMGYFQTSKYFEEIADPLRAELQELLSTVTVDEDLADALSDERSVAVHVRRGDYLELPAFQVCGSEYYRAAIETMRARVPGAQFYFFSDDPEWCAQAFQEADQTIATPVVRDENPLRDLRLMSLARHQIIANSSYSWWAAWLAKRAGQEVIMPDRWFAQDITAPIEEKRLPHWRVVA